MARRRMTAAEQIVTTATREAAACKRLLTETLADPEAASDEKTAARQVLADSKGRLRAAIKAAH